MVRKIKEEEKTEKAIRALIRLPENRRCINCDSLGPQYVCTTFWTFICTTCSGIHREFTHRVKSISIARFSAEEVSALQAAGNERARQLYFKGWDPESYTLPDESNIPRLRDFIKNVYVDRLYTSERGQISLPSVRTRLKEDQFGIRKALAYASESGRSSSFDSKDKSSYSGRFSPLMKAYQGSFRGFIEERNTSGSLESSRSGSSRKSTSRFEVVDYRFRENVSGSGKQSESHKCISPRVHKDVAGGNGISSKVGEQSNGKARKDFDASSDNQTVRLESLIDFSEDFEPSGDAGSPSNVTSSKEKEQMAPTVNTLESLLFGLSDTDVVQSTSPAQTMLISANQNSSTDAGAKDVLLQPCDASSVDCDANVGASEGLQSAVVPQYQTSAASDSSFTSQGSSEEFRNSGGQDSRKKVLLQSNSHVLPVFDPSSSSKHGFPACILQPSHVPHIHDVPSSAMAEQPSWAISNSGADNGFAVQTNGGRKELPADLFSGSYMFGAAVSGWQTGQWHSMGFNQPYHPHLMSISSFPNASRSTNPFDDYSCEPCSVQPTAFSSMASLQEVLPMTSSVVPQQSPYYTTAPSASMGEAAQTGLPPSRLRETGAMGDDLFGSLTETSRSATGGYSVTTQQNTSPTTGGNPFW